MDAHDLVLYRTAGDVHALRRSVALLALLPFAAMAQDDSAVLTWNQIDSTDVAGFRIYYGRAPHALTGMHQVLDATARTTTVDGLEDGTWYFSVIAVARNGAESEPSNLFCMVIPSGSCEAPVDEERSSRGETSAPNVRVSIGNVNSGNGGFDLSIDGNGPVTIALAGDLLFDWCSPRGSSGLPTLTPTTPSLGDRDDDGNRRQAVTFTAPVARTRCDVDGADGASAAFRGATITVQGVSKPLVEARGSWSAQFP